MFITNATQIEQVIARYFKGLFVGDTALLASVFHEEACLFGDISDTPYFKRLDEYLAGVGSRKSPKDLGEAERMKILSIEILGNVATARLHVPMLGFNYFDFLTLRKAAGEWKIVGKLFTHVAESEEAAVL